MNKTYALLLAILRNQMTGEPLQIPADADFSALHHLAARHKLEPFVYQALEGCPHAPQDMMIQLEGAYHRAFYKDIQFDFTRQQITDRLSALQIPHVFLRGICLKQDYPVSALRTMSDTDVLVYPEDLAAISEAMLQLGGIALPGDGNHKTFGFPGDVAVEFHPNLIHCASQVATGINPGWQYVPSQSGYQKQMTEEGFYLNVMCHLANHFAVGGVGVRFVLDIWVCRHLRKTQPDRTFVEQELERIGIREFALLIEELSEVWFSGAPSNELLEELGEYIFTSGSHGVADRAILNAVAYAKGKKGTAFFKKVFYPRQEMEIRYPWLQGRPWLLLAAWFVRICRVILCRPDAIRQWRLESAAISEEAVSDQNEMLKRFRLQ